MAAGTAVSGRGLDLQPDILYTQLSRRKLSSGWRQRYWLSEISVVGYSGTRLSKKLGIKEGYRVRTTGAPANYLKLLGPVPKDVRISGRIANRIDVWHFFTKSQSELASKLPTMMTAIQANGAIWVSWPKKSSGVPSSVTEDSIRTVALPLGLVDVKVCAVDQTWSGLKLVIRKELRK